VLDVAGAIYFHLATIATEAAPKRYPRENTPNSTTTKSRSGPASRASVCRLCKVTPMKRRTVVCPQSDATGCWALDQTAFALGCQVPLLYSL
jgi:hypothetical protein